MRNLVILLLTVIFVSQNTFAQQSYNDCPNALEVCPNSIYFATNIDANVTFCPGCEDDFNFCFATDNTIWFTFVTNSTGGDVQVDFTNLVFENNPGQDNELQATIIQALTPCDATSYSQLGNCVSNATIGFSLNAIGLAANTTYYIVVDGDNNGAGITSPAECSFDVSISGAGVDRPVPGISISPNSTNICENEVAVFTATLQNCPDSIDYSWFVNGVLQSVSASPVFQISSLNDGDVVTVENSCYAQCAELVADASVPISVYSFNVDAGQDQTISPGVSVTLNGITSAPTYSWSPDYLFSDPFSLNTIVSPGQTVTLALTATENGCTLSDYVTIFVTSSLNIPNTFSPNGDGHNDTWIIEGIELYPNASMKIYDRWGQLIHQATGYSSVKAWNGNIKSGKATEGVYFYILDLEYGDIDLFKGSITLIR
jgi:gliding motility-associated-like protein